MSDARETLSLHRSTEGAGGGYAEICREARDGTNCPSPAWVIGPKRRGRPGGRPLRSRLSGPFLPAGEGGREPLPVAGPRRAVVAGHVDPGAGVANRLQAARLAGG